MLQLERGLVTDQAASLRIIRGGTQDVASLRRAIAVTGGKGGVGKSTVALNLALAHVKAGAQTLMVDTDLGMADLNLLLGVAPERSILDALGGVPVEEILVEAHGLKLLPALNGSYLLSTLGPGGQRRILELVESLATKFDTLVIDIAAGIGQAQTMFASATSDTVVVVNPEPLSMADAYACLKVLATEQKLRHAFVVPNRVTSRAQADELVARLGGLVNRFLELKITALPPIPADPSVGEAAQYGVPLMVHAPDAPAARAIRQVVRALSTFAPSRPTAWSRTGAARAEGATR